MEIYIIQDKVVGYQIMTNETQNISCLEFTKLCDAIIQQYGKDLFILKEELEKRGFTTTTIECIYTIKRNDRS